MPDGIPCNAGQQAFVTARLVLAAPDALKGLDVKAILEGVKDSDRLIQELNGAFQRLLIPAPPVFLGRLVASTEVVVNRKPTVERMVELGKFDYRWDNGGINSANFPHDAGRPKKEKVVIDWFEYPDGTESDPIVADLAAQSHRPMTCDETLYVAIGHPQLQLERPRVGLGSSWTDPGSFRLVPVLYRYDTARDLRLGGWGRRWRSICLFGAVAM